MFETTFNDDQLEELFYDRLSEPIYRAVYDTIQEMIEYKELMDSNKDAQKQNPHYVVKWRNKNAFEDDFRIIGYFKTEAEAKERINYEQCITECDE